MKLNQIDLETASEVANSENETLIEEIINPMSGLLLMMTLMLILNLVFKIVIQILALQYLIPLKQEQTIYQKIPEKKLVH